MKFALALLSAMMFAAAAPAQTVLNGCYIDPTALAGDFIWTNESMSDDGATVVVPPSPSVWAGSTPAASFDFSSFTSAVQVNANARTTDSGFTAISPTFAIGVSHVPGNGALEWIAPSGAVVSRSNAGDVEGTSRWSFATELEFISGSPDFLMRKISSSLPSSIAPARLIYDKTAVVGLKAVALEKDRHCNVVTIAAYSGTSFIVNTGADAIESGDSGKPVFLLTTAGPVMLGVLGSAGTGFASGYDLRHAPLYTAIRGVLVANGEDVTLVRLIDGGRPAAMLRRKRQ